MFRCCDNYFVGKTIFVIYINNSLNVLFYSVREFIFRLVQCMHVYCTAPDNAQSTHAVCRAVKNEGSCRGASNFIQLFRTVIEDKRYVIVNPSQVTSPCGTTIDK